MRIFAIESPELLIMGFSQQLQQVQTDIQAIMKTSLIIALLFSVQSFAQNRIDSFRMFNDVKITIDAPSELHGSKKILIIYALPNGNTTEQTMGKTMQAGDDWHFDIQHIKAQTSFIRNGSKENFIVAYLENNYKSWPLWKQKHPDFRNEIVHIVDTLLAYSGASALYLNGHSGGGSFIFGYLDGIGKIPAVVERITFLDSNYGYDSSYYLRFKNWLKENKKATLTVFAYNDSVALYNGKSVVSVYGGTWHKSHAMLHQLQGDFQMQKMRDDSVITYEDKKKRIGFFLKTNPDRKIFHTQQVELNGFIHSILFGTKKENKGYRYFDRRAYSLLIE
jgi:hypothetical protein